MRNGAIAATEKSREQFLKERLEYLGGSDAASVINTGRYGCSRKLFYSKVDQPKDVEDSEKMELRRGRRLEGVAAAYYEEKTGREVRYTTTCKVPGKPFLAINMDRLVDAPERKESGYLEIKVVGRGSWFAIKKNGLPDDYLIQLQWGLAVSARSWGAFAIYAPDIDELLYWDVEADKDLGELLLEKGEDWWSFHRECKILPEALPEDSPPCSGCPWELTCRGKLAQVAGSEVISRPDLAALAEKLKEVKGMEKEAKEAAETIRDEIVDSIKRKAGIYQFGEHAYTFTSVMQKRFSGEPLKKSDPALYESLRKETLVETLRAKGE